MTFVGDPRFLREDGPHHAAIEKKHDHGQRNRQPVTAQDAGGKDKKHHAMGEATGTEMIAVACKQPDTGTGPDIDQPQHRSGGVRVTVQQGDAKQQQGKTVGCQVTPGTVDQGCEEDAPQAMLFARVDSKAEQAESKPTICYFNDPQQGNKRDDDE